MWSQAAPGDACGWVCTHVHTHARSLRCDMQAPGMLTRTCSVQATCASTCAPASDLRFGRPPLLTPSQSLWGCYNNMMHCTPCCRTVSGRFSTIAGRSPAEALAGRHGVAVRNDGCRHVQRAVTSPTTWCKLQVYTKLWHVPVCVVLVFSTPAVRILSLFSAGTHGCVTTHLSS